MQNSQQDIIVEFGKWKDRWAKGELHKDLKKSPIYTQDEILGFIEAIHFIYASPIRYLPLISLSKTGELLATLGRAFNKKNYLQHGEAIHHFLNK